MCCGPPDRSPTRRYSESPLARSLFSPQVGVQFHPERAERHRQEVVGPHGEDEVHELLVVELRRQHRPGGVGDGGVGDQLVDGPQQARRRTPTTPAPRGRRRPGRPRRRRCRRRRRGRRAGPTRTRRPGRRRPAARASSRWRTDSVVANSTCPLNVWYARVRAGWCARVPSTFRPFGRSPPGSGNGCRGSAGRSAASAARISGGHSAGGSGRSRGPSEVPLVIEAALYRFAERHSHRAGPEDQAPSTKGKTRVKSAPGSAAAKRSHTSAVTRPSSAGRPWASTAPR